MRLADSTFAAIMHSSMSLCVTLRSTARTLATLPRSSSRIFVSVQIEVDRAARWRAPPRSALYTPLSAFERGLHCRVLRARVSASARIAAASSYVSRACERITPSKNRERVTSPSRRNRHLADHAQAIDVRIQRAEAVRQRLGQHRAHAVGEVDRRAAQPRLAIERRVGLHVVAHVGDRDEQAEAVARSARRYTASSKSRASAPSIVTSGRPRRSSRPRLRALLHVVRQCARFC